MGNILDVELTEDLSISVDTTGTRCFEKWGAAEGRNTLADGARGRRHVVSNTGCGHGGAQKNTSFRPPRYARAVCSVVPWGGYSGRGRVSPFRVGLTEYH